VWLIGSIRRLCVSKLSPVEYQRKEERENNEEKKHKKRKCWWRKVPNYCGDTNKSDCESAQAHARSSLWKQQKAKCSQGGKVRATGLIWVRAGWKKLNCILGELWIRSHEKTAVQCGRAGILEPRKRMEIFDRNPAFKYASTGSSPYVCGFCIFDIYILYSRRLFRDYPFGSVTHNLTGIKEGRLQFLLHKSPAKDLLL